MCGFVLHLSKNKISENIFRNSLLSIKHRGPDNLAIRKINDFFYIGHVRLSIVDLSTNSNQADVSQLDVSQSDIDQPDTAVRSPSIL